MKLISKIVAATTAALVIVPSAIVFSGCAKTETVTGEYSYESYGTVYGFKVNVEVQTDGKGDRIRSVTVDNGSGYAAVTDKQFGYSDADIWGENVQTLLNSYRGLYVDDVLNKTVALNGDAPLSKDEQGFVNFGDKLIVTGATQSSGRFLLAVQDALKSFKK